MEPIKNKKLDSLIENGTIKGYTFNNVDQNGNIVSLQKGFRNTQRLSIEFLNGELLTIDTFCSGCAQNTIMLFK